GCGKHTRGPVEKQGATRLRVRGGRDSRARRRYSRAVKAYYHARAGEYDDWWPGRGLFADRARPGWDDELATLAAALRNLPAARTLDIACGTGFLIRHLPGEVTGLDQSHAMLELARRQAPGASSTKADGSWPSRPDPSVPRWARHSWSCASSSSRTMRGEHGIARYPACGKD